MYDLAPALLARIDRLCRRDIAERSSNRNGAKAQQGSSGFAFRISIYGPHHPLSLLEITPRGATKGPATPVDEARSGPSRSLNLRTLARLLFESYVSGWEEREEGL